MSVARSGKGIVKEFTGSDVIIRAGKPCADGANHPCDASYRNNHPPKSHHSRNSTNQSPKEEQKAEFNGVECRIAKNYKCIADPM